MSKIPEYTNTVIGNRQTPNLYDPQRIEMAGATANAISKAADMVVKFDKDRQINDYNLALIQNEKQKVELVDKLKKDFEGNPEGFTKTANEALTELDKTFSASFSGDVRRKFELDSQRTNLGILERNMAWQADRMSKIQVQKLDQASKDIGALAFRYGSDGIGFDEIKKNIDSTIFAASNVLPSDRLSSLKDALYSDATTTWLSGMAQKNPIKAKKMIDSGAYDKTLGGEGLLKAYSAVSARIESMDRKAEDAHKQRRNNIFDAFELAVIKGEATEDLYKGALSVAETPSEKIKIEKMWRTSAESNPTKIIDYYRRIDGGQNVIDEIDYDSDIAIKDKVTLRNYQKARDNKEAVSPEDAARRIFSDTLKPDLMKDSNMVVRIAVARSQFEQEIAEMPKEKRTYDNLRELAIKKIGAASNDFTRTLLENNGFDTGQTKEQKIESRKNKIKKIVSRYQGNPEGLATDQEHLKLQKEIQALEATQ